MKKHLSFLVICAIAATVFSQTPLEAGLFLGTVVYQGDVSENDLFEIKEFNPCFGGLLRYHFNEKLKVRGHVLYGKISGDDNNADDKRAYLKDRGWSFNSFIVETTAVLEYHPWGRLRYSQSGMYKWSLSPYLGAGAGMASFNPRVKVKNQQDIGLFPELNRKTTSVSLPLVVGLRYDFHESYILTLEAGWRVTFNDYLDGISNNANPKKNDPFIFTGLSITYFIGYDVRYF